MATFTGRAPKDTYGDIIQVANANDGIDATLRFISDGKGTNSSFKLSSTGSQETGTLLVTGVLTTTATQVANGGIAITSGQTLTTNTIVETTAASGVTIDSVLLKDNTVLAGTLTIGAGSITDSSGAISFGDENLSTTGTLASGLLTVNGGTTNIVANFNSTDADCFMTFADDSTTSNNVRFGARGNDAVIYGTNNVALTMNSSSAIFAGEISTTAGGLTINDTGGNADIQITDATGNVGLGLSPANTSGSGHAYISNYKVGASTYFRCSNSTSADTTWLTATSAGNATFAGDVSSKKLSAIAASGIHLLRTDITTEATEMLNIGSTSATTVLAYVTTGTGESATATGIRVRKNSSSSRSINAAGTVNASGADYAEYMKLCPEMPQFAKGDIVGVDANGELTNIFADAHTFMVKSTDPNLVGGDSWGGEENIGKEPRLEDFTTVVEDGDNTVDQAGFDSALIVFKEALEAERIKYDRIAYCGQAPVNVVGANAGDFLVPVEENGLVSGKFVSSEDLTFEQSKQAIGKAFKPSANGQTWLAVGIK
ncbi:hypothetical protein OAF54_00875 [bacterium]|nr:hypothetical protein [bacterium]